MPPRGPSTATAIPAGMRPPEDRGRVAGSRFRPSGPLQPGQRAAIRHAYCAYRIQVPRATRGGMWHLETRRDNSSWGNRFTAIEARKLALLVVSTRGSNPESDTPSIYEMQVFDTSGK